MQSYSIWLINEKKGSYNRISWIVVFIHFIVFSYAALLSPDPVINTRGAAVVLTIAAALAFFAYRTRKKLLPKPYVASIYFGLVIGWILMGYYAFAVIPVCFAILYFIATRDFEVRLTNTEIIYPSFPAKHWAWEQLNVVLLKDGLLTIERKPDRLIQQLIDEKKTKVDEAEINEFCRQQLRSIKTAASKMIS